MASTPANARESVTASLRAALARRGAPVDDERVAAAAADWISRHAAADGLSEEQAAHELCTRSGWADTAAAALHAMWDGPGHRAHGPGFAPRPAAAEEDHWDALVETEYAGWSDGLVPRADPYAHGAPIPMAVLGRLIAALGFVGRTAAANDETCTASEASLLVVDLGLALSEQHGTGSTACCSAHTLRAAAALLGQAADCLHARAWVGCACQDAHEHAADDLAAAERLALDAAQVWSSLACLS